MNKRSLFLFLTLGIAMADLSETQAAILLQYNFDTSSPDGMTFYDSSGNGSDVIFNRPMASSTSYPFSGSELDGVDLSALSSYPATVATNGSVADVSHITLSLNHQFTIEGWVRPSGDGFGNGGAILALGGAINGTSNFTLGYDDQGYIAAVFLSSSSGDLYLSTEKISYDQWNHIAYSYDGGTIRLYLNAQEVGSYFVGRTLPAQLEHATILAGGGMGQIEGFIDDIRLSDVALTPEELGYHNAFTQIPEPASLGLVVIPALLHVVARRRSLPASSK